MRPNNSFKPTPLRSGKTVAETACHCFTSTTLRGLTQALGLSGDSRLKHVIFLPILVFALAACDHEKSRLEDRIEGLTSQVSAARAALEKAEAAENLAYSNLDSYRTELRRKEAELHYLNIAEGGDAGTTEALIALKKRMENPRIEQDLTEEIVQIKNRIAKLEGDLKSSTTAARDAKLKLSDARERHKKTQEQLERYLHAKA